MMGKGGGMIRKMRGRGGPYEVVGDERQTKANLRVAAGCDGFGGN